VKLVSLGCWRYGVSQTPTENPITVVVGVEKQSTKQWTADSRRIQGILSHFGVSGVDNLFQKNEIRRYMENLTLAPGACHQSLRPSVRIGIDQSTAGSSTLGGLVKLQFRNQQWRQFGITCFHAVYPPPHHRVTLNPIPGAADG
jgi:hypothetical protein